MFEIFRTHFVEGALLVAGVAWTVNFNDEKDRRARKVDGEFSDRVLAAEFVA